MIRRRCFLQAASAAVALPIAVHAQKKEDQDVSPAEDLMREHGILKRVILVYRESIRRIETNADLPPDVLKNAADLIRTFVENYHEKLEEDYLFPRFQRPGSWSS
jgi:hemerythrin-like domain-containing protein